MSLPPPDYLRKILYGEILVETPKG